MRLDSGAVLAYDGNGTNGFANLNGGRADVFAHAWEAGYQNVTIAYNAAKGAHFVLSVNGQSAATVTAQSDGAQTSIVRVAFSEGINQLTLSGAAGVRVASVTTARASESDSKAIRFEAEDAQLSGGAKVQKDDASDASGKSFVAGWATSS